MQYLFLSYSHDGCVLPLTEENIQLGPWVGCSDLPIFVK